MTFKVYSFYAGHDSFGFVIEATDQRSWRIYGEQWTRNMAKLAKNWAVEVFGVRRENVRFSHC